MSEAEQTPEPAAPDAAETEARAKGWVPKDEYKGKRDWKPADEWLADGDEIATLRKELAETKNALLDFGRQNREAAMAEARAKREAELDNAVETGDKVAARKAADGIKKLDKEESDVEMPKPAKAFIDSNKDWFGYHDRATEFARMRERKLINDGVDLADVYDTIAGEVKSRFPEIFDNPQASRSAVDAGGSPRTGSRKKSHGLTINDLEVSETFKKIGRDFVKRGVMTEEAYIKSLIDDGTVRIT